MNLSQRASNARIGVELGKLLSLETAENKADLELLMELVTINERLREDEENFRSGEVNQPLGRWLVGWLVGW